MPIHSRRIFILFLAFVMTLLTACELPRKPNKEIQLVQNSKEAYGPIHDTLIELDEMSIIQKIPPFREVAEFTFSDFNWSSFQSDSGQILVQLEGNMKVQGIETPIIIQWRLEGNLDTGNATIVPHAFAMNRETQNKEVFNSFTISTLYNMDVLTDDERAALSLILAVDESIFPIKSAE